MSDCCRIKTWHRRSDLYLFFFLLSSLFFYMHVSCTLKKTDPQVQIKAMCRFHPSPSSNQSRAGAITSHPPPNWVVSVKNDSAASSDTRTCVSACDSAAFPSCQVDTTFKSLTSRSWTVHAMWDRHTRHGHNPHVHWTQTCILRQTHSYCTTECVHGQIWVSFNMDSSDSQNTVIISLSDFDMFWKIRNVV